MAMFLQSVYSVVSRISYRRWGESRGKLSAFCASIAKILSKKSLNHTTNYLCKKLVIVLLRTILIGMRAYSPKFFKIVQFSVF